MGIATEDRKRTLRIVIVDDHAVFCDGLRLLIEKQDGFSVVGEARNARDAVTTIKRLQPDIVLLDLDLAGNSGLDVIEELNGFPEGTRFLVLTGIRDRELYHRAVRLGAMGVVTKENAGPVLIKAIQKVAEGEVWLDHSMVAAVLAEARRAGRADTGDPDRRNIETLTDRERQITALVAEGRSTKELAESLCISEKTVRNHLASIYGKLDVSDRLDLALYALRHGLARRSKS